jgi:predicted ATPase
MLVLLDNFEHVLSAATAVSQLLRECPNVDVLVTSRELLQLAAEHVYPVPSLADPEAVELFNARARAVQPGFVPDGSVAELCARLDNLPLALELAAARVRVFSVDELRERLAQRLDFFRAGRDADPRQATLRATIEWSYDLLDHEEKRVFACLAVFAGGCTLEAAERVCEADADTLVSLVDKSLVRRREDGRLWMLETIRELAAEQLDELAESDSVRARHARYFTELAEALGLAMESLSAGHRQRYDLGLPEIDNFRAALRWSEEADPVLGLELAVRLENLWVTQNLADGTRHLETLLARAEDAPLSLRAAGLRCIGSSAIVVDGDPVACRGRYTESLELYRQAGDEWGIAVVEHRLGVTAMQLDDWPRARPLLERALERARRLGIAVVEGQVLGSLASLEQRDGNPRKALELAVQSVDAARRIGFDWWHASMLGYAAELAHELGQRAQAEQYAREALALAYRIGDRLGTILGVAELARVAASRGDAERAGRLWGALEREAARAPLVMWERIRPEIARDVDHAAGDEFERGRAAGLHLSLDEAVEEEFGGA